jgi:hypothetical protein
LVTGLLNKVFKRKDAAGESNVDRLLQSVVERRVSPRFEVVYMTNIYVTQRPLSALVVDISLSGARFATRLPRDTGSVIGLEITVDDKTLILPLRVLWDRWGGGYFENGGSFVDLTHDETVHLQRFVLYASNHPIDPKDRPNIAELLIAKAMEGLPLLVST